jgi:AcrR family transcriptional regulator
VATKRSYQQTRRAETAAVTRAKIVEAAKEELLCGRRFTIDSVARRAAVTRPTVYAQFGNREQLRDAVFDQLAERGGLATIPEAFTQSDAVSAIRRFVEIMCRFYATHRTVLRKLHALALLDETDWMHAHQGDDRRRRALTVLLTRLGNERADRLKPLHTQATLPVVQALTSFEFFDQVAGSTSDGSSTADCISGVIESILHP